MAGHNMHYAIYGGTFDPFHIGHFALAQHAVQECGIDKLIIMPDRISPFKLDKKVTDGKDRCGMIRSILHRDSAFCLSTYEMRKEGPSYSVETLRYWRSILNGELSFVLGFDSVAQIDNWYEGEEILRDYHLITARRPDTDDTETLDRIQYFRDTFGAKITVLEMDPVDASSTEIRRRVEAGMPVTDMVLPEVEEYIIEHQLYR